jgi:hypothetical protein
MKHYRQLLHQFRRVKNFAGMVAAADGSPSKQARMHAFSSKTVGNWTKAVSTASQKASIALEKTVSLLIKHY